VLISPATIALTVRLPDGTTDGPFTPASDGTGLYHYDYTPTTAGQHIARWVTTAPAGADEEPFDVAAEWAEAGVISLRDAKKQLNIDPASTDDDEEIAGFLRSVTEVCERYVGALGRTSYTEKHQGGYMIALNRAPVLSLTSVVAVRTGGLGQSVADLDLDEPTGIVQRKDGCRMCGPLRVTYVAGRTSVPPNVRQAALIILQHLWETQRGDVAPRFGIEETWDPRLGYAIPRRALELLGDQPPGIA
jgi:hypothetical protein